MNLDELLGQLLLARAKKALQSSLAQVDQLFGLLEPHMSEDVLFKMKESFMAQIVRDLSED